jgi:small subunit ribosomal protein S5
MRQEFDYIDSDEVETLDLTDNTIQINRSAKVMKGGRRFGFGALVVVGDGRGVVGLGYGKAREVPPAIEKAVADAKKHLVRVSLVNSTFPHPVVSRFRSSIVKLLPASAGTGVLAGKPVRAVLEAAGVTDALTKALGSKNEVNLAKATFYGLLKMRTRQEIEAVRGLEIR